MNIQEPCSDRRRFAREDVHVPVRYEIKASKQFGATLTKDISEGGIKMTLERFLPLHTEVKLNINLEEIATLVHALGSIAWLRQIPYSDRYQLGIKFLEMDENYKKSLREYLRRRRLKAAFSL
ncbi:PilZ domain-containing protein [Candidatus Omnitrophota bacterium]